MGRSRQHLPADLRTHQRHWQGRAERSLSLQRANVIEQRLVRESGELAARIETVGVGSAQNILGSGTDDAANALDRRVEFEVTACEAQSA